MADILSSSSLSAVAPTAVRNLVAVAPDPTHINVMWDQPTTLNGNVSYIISIVGMDLSTESTVLNETAGPVSETLHSFETAVEEYAVYVVMVTALTGGGQGPTVETDFTTPEGGTHTTNTLFVYTISVVLNLSITMHCLAV